jgi:hypothetical protein
MKTIDRESLGRKVREIEIAYGKEQHEPNPIWLVPWEQLHESDKEVCRRVGEQLFGLGVMTAMRPVKARRVCAECGASIGKHHKWFIGADSKVRHRDCSNPTGKTP